MKYILFHTFSFQFLFIQDLAVSCWPTLLFVGPEGNILYSVAGEGHRERVIEFLKVAVEFYSSNDQLTPTTIPKSLEADKKIKSNLNFPGKISLWQECQKLLIADSGNNRIIVTDLDGIVEVIL